MVNALFVDYTTILDSDCNLKDDAVQALKSIVRQVDDIRIVCLDNDADMPTVKYDSAIDKLSQALALKKVLFFSRVENGVEKHEAIAKWMSSREVKSFAIVTCKEDVGISKAYPNNYSCGARDFSQVIADDVVWKMSNFKNAISSSNSSIWFTSDTHFGHANIIKYCNRPWNHGKNANGEVIATSEDVLAMDNEIIRRWNSVVGKNDIVWHLGDFALGGKSVAERVFPQLNGKINLVMGNHDHWKIDWYYNLGFHRVYDRKVIINDFVILTHAPLMFLNSNSPFFQVYGHIHDSPAYQTWTKTSACVCVERHDYYPVSWKTIKEKYDEMNKGDE